MNITIAKAEECNDLVVFLNTVFGRGQANQPQFDQMYPDIFKPTTEKMAPHTLIKDENTGKILSCVGSYPLDMVVDGCKVPIIGIGQVSTAEEALQGAKDIIAEMISDEADHRTYIREITIQEGKLVSNAKDEKAESVYEMYYDYEEAIKSVAGHRTLAINRGETEKFLTVKIEAPQERILTYLEKKNQLVLK